MSLSWERLRERKLVQWALAYLAGAWLILQVIGLLAEPFGWPMLVLRAAVVLLAVGFLAVLVVQEQIAREIATALRVRLGANGVVVRGSTKRL